MSKTAKVKGVPLLHTSYGKHGVAIEVRTLKVLEGRIPRRALGLAIEWASQHQEELLQNWELARQNQRLNKIAPLE